MNGVAWKVNNGVFSIGQVSGDVLTFDLEGRIIYASLAGRSYRRTIMNRFLEISSARGVRSIRELESSESERVTEAVYRRLEKLAVNAGLPSVDETGLDWIGKRDWKWLTSDAMRLLEIYGGGIPVIPPDQYFALYVRYTRGCSWNRCSFCRLYTGISYAVGSTGTVVSQVNSLRAVLGRGIYSRRSVFLGDANAINSSTVEVVKVIRTLHETLGLPVYAFSDAFTTPRNKGESDYRQMHSAGLERVYIGVESGSRKVLEILNKPMDLQTAMDEIRQMKAAGLSLGIIIMSGAGGRVLAEEHIRDTSGFVAALPLGRGDVVYISPMVEYSNSPYYDTVMAHNLGVLPTDEKMTQAQELKDNIVRLWRERNLRDPDFPVAPYLLAESIY
ncbi:MAG: radical SAM protein [Thermoplasmataceae archaeon]